MDKNKIELAKSINKLTKQLSKIHRTFTHAMPLAKTEEYKKLIEETPEDEFCPLRTLTEPKTLEQQLTGAKFRVESLEAKIKDREAEEDKYYKPQISEFRYGLEYHEKQPNGLYSDEEVGVHFMLSDVLKQHSVDSVPELREGIRVKKICDEDFTSLNLVRFDEKGPWQIGFPKLGVIEISYVAPFEYRVVFCADGKRFVYSIFLKNQLDLIEALRDIVNKFNLK